MLSLARRAVGRALRTAPGRLFEAVYVRTFGWCRADVFELERPAGAVPASRASFPAGYAFRRARRDEAAACAEVAGLPVAEVLRRHDAGDVCWMVARGSRAATVMWVHDGAFYVRGLGYLHDAPPGEKYLYGAVTDPADRGQGLFKNVLQEVLARVFAEGANRIVEIVEVGNTPSAVTVSKLGHRPTRRIHSVLFLGLRRTVVRPLDGARSARTWRVLPPPGRFVI